MEDPMMMLEPMGHDMTHEPMTTPSPSSTGAGMPTPASHSATRRPTRKSTLTQQQKNQKRQRATQDQLITLEVEFNSNPTPTAAVRERIASEINMTERSVQIWFQNRRAKIKNLAKKSIESGEDCNDIPESMRRYLAMQAMESGKGLGRDLLNRGAFAYGSGMLLNNESNSSKVVIHHFSCRSLSIGSWRRVGQSAMDLVIFYSPDKCCVTYYINNDSAGYKIEYPFSSIKNITLDNGDPHSGAEGASQRPGGLIVELTRPPYFHMDSSGQGGFYQCGDFTEEQQASQVLVHHLGGHPKVLSGQLAKLIALESFQNRHKIFDPSQLAASAPVSPIPHRPASQPNQQIAHTPVNLFHDTPWGVGVGLAPPRGHKRQRSRSVPIAIDFSMLRNPMQPFLIPGPPQPPEPAPYIHQPDIIAPVPQYHVPQGPLGPTLSIDTSAGYGMAFPHYNPGAVSATTAPSPATEYGTPATFFSAAPQPEAMPASHMGPQFVMPFASPMHEMTNTTSMAPPHPSVSPMPPPMCPDPIIANQSPPLTSLGRGQSADMYHMHHENVMPEDGMTLGDMYGKHPMALPFRPIPEEPSHHELDMNAMMNFAGTIDPSALAHQHLPM